MGACISQKNDQQFSMNDLNGMEKYYSILPKRKADVLRWMTSSEGPWKVPESFSCLQITDAKMNPLEVSNEDEIRIHALQLKTNVESDSKKTSRFHADRDRLSMTFNQIDSVLPIRSQSNSGWSTGW